MCHFTLFVTSVKEIKYSLTSHFNYNSVCTYPIEKLTESSQSNQPRAQVYSRQTLRAPPDTLWRVFAEISRFNYCIPFLFSDNQTPGWPPFIEEISSIRMKWYPFSFIMRTEKDINSWLASVFPFNHTSINQSRISKWMSFRIETRE